MADHAEGTSSPAQFSDAGPFLFPQTSPGRPALRASLDELERDIVAALRADGRRPWRDIARQIGTSESTVARRARALIDVGVFRPTIAIDPQRCGFGYPVVLRLTCEFGAAAKVAMALAARSDIRFVVHLAGEFDILAELIVRSSQGLASVLIEELPRIAGISRVVTSTVLRAYQPHQDWTGLDLMGWGPAVLDADQAVGTLSLDDIDHRLMAALQADCRASFPALALEVNASESVVRRRLEALIERRAIRPTVLIDPAALGFDIELFASIHREPG